MGKVPSVHLSKNINKSHHCELITKSQVACIKKKREGWGADSWNWLLQLRFVEMAKIYVDRRHDISRSLTCSLGAIHTHMHSAQRTYINTITHRKKSDTDTCAEESWNAKSC